MDFPKGQEPTGEGEGAEDVRPYQCLDGSENPDCFFDMRDEYGNEIYFCCAMGFIAGKVRAGGQGRGRTTLPRAGVAVEMNVRASRRTAARPAAELDYRSELPPVPQIERR